jgi:hypothetical protein
MRGLDWQLALVDTQFVTTINCNRSTNSHTLQFTTARAKSSQFLFTSLHLVTAPINVDSSGSVFSGSCPCCLATVSHLANTPDVITFSPFWSRLSESLLHRFRELLSDWWFTANQFFLAPSPLRIMTRDFFN